MDTNILLTKVSNCVPFISWSVVTEFPKEGSTSLEGRFSYWLRLGKQKKLHILSIKGRYYVFYKYR